MKKPCVFIVLKGGLGNQMFQYAMGRSLALRTGAQLILLSPSKTAARKYALSVFNISATAASPIQSYALQIASLPFCRRIGNLLLGIISLRTVCFIRDREAGFDRSIGDLHGSLVIDGYWQSEKYFLACELAIRNDFRFLSVASLENQTLLDQIARLKAVAVHVRRGDYVSNAQSNYVHGTCSLEYYVAATNIMRGRLGDPKFFVFSDDPDWVEQHLRLDGSTEIVRINQGSADFEDMRLMAACKHFIIANSSFSWWAAWLGVHPDKVVVAPKRWFSNHHANTCDLLPDTWIRI